MLIPLTPRELIHYINREFSPGESLPGIRPSSKFIYDGLGTYLRESKHYGHLVGEKVVLVDSHSSTTMGKIELFSDILYLLLIEYLEDPRSEFIASPNAKLDKFLRIKGVRTKYPNLHTHESYYAAVVKKLAEKLEQKV